MRPLNISRENFPDSERVAEGMINLPAICGPYEITYHEDVVYSEYDGKKLHLQILLPADQKEEAPLILYIPGSAFHRQNVKNRIPTLAYWAQKGYAVALLEYRGSEDAVFPSVIVDAKAGIVYLKEHAKKYHINPDKIVTYGDSSGGYTALMAGLTYRVDTLEDERSKGKDYSVCGIVDYFGPTDFATMSNEPSSMDHIEPDCPEGAFMGHVAITADSEWVKSSAIKQYVTDDRKLPPVLMFHGSADELVPFAQSCELYEALKEQGHEVTLYRVEHAHHGGPQFWSEAVLNVVEAFMQRVFE